MDTNGQTEVSSEWLAALYEQQQSIIAELKHANKIAEISAQQAVLTARHTKTIALVAGAFSLLMALGLIGSICAAMMH